MNVVTEDDPISINTDGICIHSGFSVAKAESEVRLFPSGLCVVVNVFFFKEVIHIVTFSSENAQN